MELFRKKIITSTIIVVLVIFAMLLYFYKTQTSWIESPEYQRASKSPAKTLVVVYSRTGNTLSGAKEVARYFDADLLRIKAPQYARTLKGHALASKHADEEITTTPINHAPVTISNYDLVILCSPTWWFRPAPPMWSFVENNDFSGKPVFLLMTGNSRRKEEFTNKFAKLVEKQNGRFLDSIFIRRGRIYWQKNPDELNNEIRNTLDEHQNIWP